MIDRLTFTESDLREVARRAAIEGEVTYPEQVAERIVRDFLKERKAKP